MGTGNYSTISLYKEKATGKEFAIKTYSKQRIKQVNKLADLKMEKHSLAILKDCKSVARIYETF